MSFDITDFQILGDPHLGRRFVHNVPLHRRGDRERMIKEQFVKELNPRHSLFHVCMGDLFDHAEVSFETILFASQTYIAAARTYPKAKFIIIRGNHDAGRDLEAVTAFDLFAMLVQGEKNIVVVTDWYQFGEYVFFGWQANKSAEEVVAGATFDGAEVAFGHWDVDLRSPSFNLIPTRLLAERGIEQVFTGHVHASQEFERDGVKVVVTGSMTGLAHGEGHPYVTLTLDELATTDVTDLCVRLLLEEGEAPPDVPNCLQWQVKYPEKEVVMEKAELASFNLQSLYDEAFESRDIDEGIKKEVDARWRAIFTKQD